MSDQELADAFTAWANARIAAIEAGIRSEREYISAAEGARRLCLPSKRQFVSLMARWGILGVYLSPGRRRWRWSAVESVLQKRELRPPQKLKIAA